MRALTLAATAVAAVVLVGCAQPAAEQTEAPSAAPTPSATAPSPTPSSIPTPAAAPVDPYEGWQRIETLNGSASFLIPPGWTAELDGELVDYDGTAWWSNAVRVLDDAGVARLGYWDGPGDDVGAALSFEVLAEERLDALDGAELEGIDDAGSKWNEQWARAWWSSGGGDVFAQVRVSPGRDAGEQPGRSFSDGRRLISFGTSATFPTEAEAVAWLAGDEAAEVFAIVRTLDLHGAPADAMPEQ